uniref:Sm domain-containing protein n=1 Tax=Glossina morsitans morsitans TaxID=37546 RepID=A0A1B0G7W8_GLOMM
MQKFTRKEIFLKANTLNCVPIILQGHGVLIDLRNECSVAGRIDNADGHMNINLIEAVFIDRLQRQHAFEQFMVRERMIRQIHIPPHINITQEIHDWCESGCGRPKLKINKKRTFKEKRVQVKHKEILDEIAQKQKHQTETETQFNCEN